MSDAWMELFDKAMVCLDASEDRAPEWLQWSFGGGTALMLQIGHRVSKDIDIFLNSPQFMRDLSPGSNPVSASMCNTYDEGSDFVKLRRDEGEIDFIVSPHVLDEPWQEVDIRGRRVLLETPAEIVAKKMFYKAETFATRDIFDLAAVLVHDLHALDAAKRVVLPHMDLLAARLRMMRERYSLEVTAELTVLPGWSQLLKDAPQIASEFVAYALGDVEPTVDGLTELPSPKKKKRPRL